MTITRRGLLQRILQAVPVAGACALGAGARRKHAQAAIANDGVLVLRVEWAAIDRDPIGATNEVLDRLIGMMPRVWQARGWENRFSFCLHPQWVARLKEARGEDSGKIEWDSGLRYREVCIISIGGAHIGDDPNEKSLYAVLGHHTYPTDFAGPRRRKWHPWSPYGP